MDRQIAPPVTVKHRLSKSKIIAGRQCERRVWLEVHRSDLRSFSQAQSSRLDQGTAFGEAARIALGPGELVDCRDTGAALRKTRDLLAQTEPPTHVFEAALQHRNVVVRADALRRAGASFDLIEVKSTAKIKNYYLEDCAIQTWVARGAGVPVRRAILALANPHVRFVKAHVHPEMLVLRDVTEEINDRQQDVATWVDKFTSVVLDREPMVRTGKHCQSPFGCPFVKHCG